MIKIIIAADKLLIKLINIPSLSEHELPLCQLLKKLPFDQVKKQPVDKQGFNIIAQKRNPKTTFRPGKIKGDKKNSKYPYLP